MNSCVLWFARQYLDYVDSEEARAVNRLLEAYASAEDEAVAKVVKMQIFELALQNQVNFLKSFPLFSRSGRAPSV